MFKVTLKNVEQWKNMIKILIDTEIIVALMEKEPESSCIGNINAWDLKGFVKRNKKLLP